MNCVSIIIPVYNAAQYLDECISSAINQSYEGIEVILVDDGSTDNSLDICERWAARDDRIRVISKDNGGVSSARNKALEVAAGDYFVFLDSDDFLVQDYVEEMLQLVISTNTDIGICETRIFDENHYVITNGFSSTMITNQEAISKFFTDRSWFYVIWGRIFSRKAICESNGSLIKFDESLLVGEDLVWLMEVMSKKKQFNVSCTSKSLYNYRRFSAHSSLSNYRSQGYVAKRYSLIKACATVCEIFERMGFAEEYWLCANEMMKYFVNGSVVIYSIGGYQTYAKFNRYCQGLISEVFASGKLGIKLRVKIFLLQVIFYCRFPRFFVQKMLEINEKKRKRDLYL